MKKLAVLFFVVAIGCQPSGKEDKVDLKALKDEVFEIHDDVMPKMGDLRRVRKSLALQADSIMESDGERAELLLSVSKEIEMANESMMNWMRNFDPNFEGDYQQELDYLNEKKESMIKVRDAMLQSMEKGQKILEEN